MVAHWFHSMPSPQQTCSATLVHQEHLIAERLALAQVPLRHPAIVLWSQITCSLSWACFWSTLCHCSAASQRCTCLLYPSALHQLWQNFQRFATFCLQPTPFSQSVMACLLPFTRPYNPYKLKKHHCFTLSSSQIEDQASLLTLRENGTDHLDSSVSRWQRVSLTVHAGRSGGVHSQEAGTSGEKQAD